jgi:hypothetical protein
LILASYTASRPYSPDYRSDVGDLLIWRQVTDIATPRNLVRWPRMGHLSHRLRVIGWTDQFGGGQTSRPSMSDATMIQCIAQLSGVRYLVLAE